ncbi:MAG: PP2C family protein-serine/threonine phosphatase, partial [Spirochaetota bacterium]
YRISAIYTGKNAGFQIGVLLGGVGVILEILGLIAGVSPAIRALIDIYMVIMVIVLLIILSNITERNGPTAWEVIESRRLFAYYIPILLLLTVLPYDGPLAQYIVVPSLSLPHLWLCLRYYNFYDSRQSTQIDFTRGYIASIFNFMETIGHAMTEHLQIDRVLDYILDAILSSTKADAAAALLIDEYRDELRVRSTRGFYPPPYAVPQVALSKRGGVETYFRSQPIPIGDTVLGEAVQSGKPIFIRDAFSDERMQHNREEATYVSSIIVLPLRVEERVLGVVSFVNRKSGSYFDDDDFERCRVFSDYASLTLANLYAHMQVLEKQEIEQEVGIAADIQRRLLPIQLPRLPGSEIASFTNPARGVSGDYYDILPLNEKGRCALVVCDVAGKGVPASLVMVMIRTIIHLVARGGRSASNIVSWINRGIAGEIDIERFATLTVVEYDPETRTVSYSNAAHHPPLLVRANNGAFEKLDTEGLPIGLEQKVEYGEGTVQLESGDMIVLYTDGIIEALNEKHEQYEEERLVRTIKANAHCRPKEIINAIKEDITEFVGRAKQHDDQTVLVLKAE